MNVDNLQPRRRGEVAFVAMRVGRSQDPREVLGLAKDLGIENALAYAYVALWEEFILEVGDALTGRVRGYQAVHIAAKLTWRGTPRRLIEAMKRAGILKVQRGTFLHPYWLETITGDYARARADRRERDRLRKARQRAASEGGAAEEEENVSHGTSADVPPEVRGTGVDVPPVSHGNPYIKKERNGGNGASRPPGPPPGGGSKASGRWEWMLQHHPRPRNPQACAPYLEAMSDEHWAQCQWVIRDARREGGPSLSQKKRVFKMDSHRFLAVAAYLEFSQEWAKKLLPREVVSLAAEIEDTEQRRAKEAREYIRAVRADESLAETKKKELIAAWLRAHPGETLEELEGGQSN